MINLKGRNFLGLEDFTPEELRYLLDLAHKEKADKKSGVSQRKYIGKNLLMLFEMESTRTRCSFESSGCDLGMGTTYLSNSHFGSKETIKDSMRVFSGMYDAIAYRGTDHKTLLEMTKDCQIPIINGFTKHQHPTQMMADFMTLEEVWGRRGFEGKTMCYVGRGGAANAVSYGVACAMLGMNFKYVTSFMTLTEAISKLTPEEQERYHREIEQGSVPDSESARFGESQRNLIESLYTKYHPECSFEETDDLDAVKGADVLTTENWGFFTNGVDAWLPGIVRYKPYQVNAELVRRTGNPNIFVLHMLPATHNCVHKGGQKLLASIADPALKEFLAKGLEVTDEVFEANAAYIFRESENRQHSIKAVLDAVLGG